MEGKARSAKTSGLASGWILVTGLLLFCGVGTWLTAHNYRQHVFSSARGVVLENQWPESRISVSFPESEARAIYPGQIANITMGDDKHLLKGAVVSVTPGKGDGHATGDTMVVVRLVGEPVAPDASGASLSPTPHHVLPVSAPCSVTIDTTIPPEVIAPGSPVSK